MKNSLDILAKHYCRYPAPLTSQFMTNTGTIRNEEGTRYYAIGNTIIGAAIKEETVRISNQYVSGQFIWDFTPIHEMILTKKEPKPISGNFTEGSKPELLKTYETVKQGKFSELFDQVTDSLNNQFHDEFPLDDIPIDDEIQNIFETMDTELDTFKKSQPENLNASFPVPSCNIKNKVASILLATGRMRIDKNDKLKQLSTESRAIDIVEKASSNSIKLGTKMGVVYVAQDSPDQNQILQTTYEETSAHFHEFITGLGYPVVLSKHVGYLGGLDAKNTKNGTSSIYYTDAMHEIMFHIAPLIPTDPNDAQQIYKKRHIGNDHVHIIWCAGNKDYNTATITSQFNQAHIVIYPLQTALFRVDVFWREGLPWFGPLRHSTVINKRALPSLVRETAEGVMLTFYQNQSAFAHPAGEVEGHINNIVENFLQKTTKKFDPMVAKKVQ